MMWRYNPDFWFHVRLTLQAPFRICHLQQVPPQIHLSLIPKFQKRSDTTGSSKSPTTSLLWLHTILTELSWSQGAIAVHLICDPYHSNRQQSLEMLSLTVTLVAYHIGIFIKTRGERPDSHIVDAFLFLLQLLLNATVVWRFFTFIFKDMMLVGWRCVVHISCFIPIPLAAWICSL